MANKTVYNYYSELPSWAKGVVVIGGGLVLYLIGSRVIKTVFPSEQQKRNRELAKNVDEEIKDLSKRGIKPSFVDSNYNTFANTIYNGMRYAVGDDYGIVETTLKKMKNDIDVAKLIKAFGERQNYAFGIPTGSAMDLFTFVQSELGNEWFGITNYRVKSVNTDWKSKGISYQI